MATAISATGSIRPEDLRRVKPVVRSLASSRSERSIARIGKRFLRYSGLIGGAVMFYAQPAMANLFDLPCFIGQPFPAWYVQSRSSVPDQRSVHGQRL